MYVHTPPTVLVWEVCLHGREDCLWNARVCTCRSTCTVHMYMYIHMCWGVRERERGGPEQQEQANATHVHVEGKRHFNSPISLPEAWCSGCRDNMHSIRTPLEVGGVTSLTHTHTHTWIRQHVHTHILIHVHVHVYTYMYWPEVYWAVSVTSYPKIPI